MSGHVGARWSFSNVVGYPIRVWDSRDRVIRSVYDDLHRRIELWVQADSAEEMLAEQTIYGEGQTDPEVSNLRGKGKYNANRSPTAMAWRRTTNTTSSPSK